MIRKRKLPRSDKGHQHQCGMCGDFGHDRRTCERRRAPAQVRLFDDSPPPPPSLPLSIDMGPWSTCVAGDPYCPCVNGVGHVGAA